MVKTLLSLLAVALCIAICFSAPITTPPPALANEKGSTEASSKDLEDVMMDPTAKMPWQKQEGDITYLTDKFLFPEDENDPFIELPDSDEKRSKRAAIKNKYRLWEKAEVPYILSDAYTANELAVIIQAMDHLENNTCIRFRPRTTERDHIAIYPGSGCYSYVGRIGRSQGVSVGRRCFAFHTALHEIVHALGFYHEQSRPDRDEHVTIVAANVLSGAESEFSKLTESKVDSLGVGYDYNSIMHYDATLFSRNGKPTIVALDPDIPIGKARELSELDIVQINKLYSCPDVPPARITIAPEVEVEERPKFPSELPFSDCGGFITSLQGTIESPGYPNYPHNTDCVWMFKTPLPGFSLLFDFEPFHVEESPDCKSDYVQIYESLDTSGYTSGPKCGNYYRFYGMSSFTSYAYLHFHTNGSNAVPNLKGFRLNYYAYDIDECNPLWKQCSHGCHNFEGGYECSCPEGFFMSSDGKTCFDINECGLDKGGCDHKCVNRAGYYHCACEEGYYLLSDNKTCLADGADDPCIEASCEHKCEMVNSQAKCVCDEGYEVDTDDKSCTDVNECLDNNGDCQHQCNNNNGSYSCSCRAGYDLLADGKSCHQADPCDVNNGGCGHICTSTGSSVACSCLPGYNLAADGKSCNDVDECASKGGKGDCDHACTNTPGSFVCSCPTGYQLQTDGITCEDIDECKINNGGCQQLNCINVEGSFLCQCGEGFKMRDDENSCAVVLSGPSGTVSSDNWPETYPNNVNDQWVIQCESNQVVELTFSNGFGMAGSLPSCSKDWVKVYDGDNTAAEIMGKFCHYALPLVPKSSSSSLLVHFYSGPSHSNSRRGFEFTYTCEDVTAVEITQPPTATALNNDLKAVSTEAVLKISTTEAPSVLPPQPSQCGQTLFTESSGTIETPNWPETYPSGLTCNYYIQLPSEDSTVEITFNEGFGIAGNYPDCPKDWVKIYDGHTDSTTQLGKYCHFHTPPIMSTSGSKAMIVLYAGPSHSSSRKGFSATYRTL